MQNMVLILYLERKRQNLHYLCHNGYPTPTIILYHLGKGFKKLYEDDHLCKKTMILRNFWLYKHYT